jgi:PAS domain S-box-containing protein
MSREPGGSVRVLHVDDDPSFAELAATFLEREDDRLTVETAGGVAEALNRLRTDAYDCVVSDYDMSDRTGIEFLETVRETDASLPFVLFTGKGSEEVASEAISAGVTDYLQKEAGTDQYAVLANRVVNAVEHDRSRRMAERGKRRLREIVDSLPHLLFVVDDRGRYLLANEALAEFHGVSVDGIEGSSVAEMLDEETAERFRTDAETVLETGRAKRVRTVELTDATGETRILEPRLLPYGLADGDEDAVLGIATDVTENRRCQRELEREERRYDAVFEDPNILVGLLDTDGTVLDVNRTALSYVDVTHADVVGRYFPRTRWFEGTDGARSRIEECIERAAAGGYAEFDLDLTRPTGESYSVAGVFRPVTDGADEVVSIIVSTRKVDERARRERRLEALNETTQELLTAETRAGIAEIGVEAARSILGLDASSIHLREGSELVPVAYTETLAEIIGDPPTFAGGESIAWRSYEQGEALAVDDVHDDPDIYNPDSPIESELYLPLGEDGLLIAGATTSGVFDRRDRALGEILAGSLTTALEQVSQREQLHARERELARRNDSLESFASVLSHDLRSPLNVATGQLELLTGECDSERVATIRHSLGRMEALIGDLLTLARRGTAVGETERVELGTLVRNCWETTETGAATLDVRTDRTVVADPSRLRQLIGNLVGNAVEHSSTTDDHVTVTVGDLETGFYLADDGHGIPADDRGSVFDAGYSTSDGGTGLGLRIVEGIADAHGWTVSVTEGADGGAHFEITGVEVEPRSPSN